MAAIEYSKLEELEWEHPMEEVTLGDSRTFVDGMGVMRTTSLFIETLSAAAKASGWEPLFTLARWDKGKYVSLYKLFKEDMDPTGYTTCMRTIGNWKQWKKLWSGRALAPHLEEWVEEVEVALSVESISKMRKMDTPASAKWLADRGWADGGKGPKRGRPSKSEVDSERKKQALIKSELEEDAKRVFN